MQKLIKTVTLSVALTLVGGCSYFGVYKRDLTQGNLVTQDLVAQLQPGMSRDEVKSIMGSPLLEAPFDANQWDYLFRLDEAYGDVDQRRVTLTFAGDRLANVATSGDLTRSLDFTPQIGPGPALDEDAGIGTNLLPSQTSNAPQGGARSSGEPGAPSGNQSADSL